MREVEFKMERQGLVKTGDEVEIIERDGVTYSYVRLLSFPGSYQIQKRNRQRNPGK